MNRDWTSELQSILNDIEQNNLRRVMSHANDSFSQPESNNYTRNKEKYSINLNDIVKLEVERICYTNKSNEYKIEKWEDYDLFIPTKTNFSANFKKFCYTLCINPENFKIGKSYAFQPDSIPIIHDILSNNPQYIHFLKYGVNKKDLARINIINKNIYNFIKNKITDPVDYETAMTNYYLYFLINSNIEVGIKSKVIDILTAPDVKMSQKLI
ncbi:hypothetical protein ACX813_000457 [Staphylococcus pseudintermedius]